MNEYCIILKGNNKDLAISEFETLWNLYKNEKVKLEEIQNTLYEFTSKYKIDKKEKFLNRLTYTNYIGINLCKSDKIKTLSKQIKSLDFSIYDNQSFRVRIKDAKKNEVHDKLEKDLAIPIWDSLIKPKVDLKNPINEFNYFLLEDENYFCVKIFENNKKYLERMPKLRPVKMPYTLKSDMARACVNLLNLKEKSIVLDPFCGIGGILLEAYDMKFKIIGNDISWNDLKYLKTNFEHYYPKANYILTLADSKTQFLKDNTIDGIVSDIPYGKSSRKLGGDELYEDFLISARKYLKVNKRMIIIYANFNEIKTLAEKYFKIIKEIDEYINRSMTRHILILENVKSE